LKNIDPYFLPKYIDVFSGGLNNLICFSYASENSNAIILLPGYLTPIVIGDNETEYFDFISPYGYTGPIFSKETTNYDINDFWENVDEWNIKNNVVSEFIRFNLYGNEREYNGNVISTMLNIKGLIISAEDQWRNFEHKVRKNVKKAQDNNLKCKVFHKNEITSDVIRDFYKIYINTMKRTNANIKFFYSFDNFVSFINESPENCAICNVFYNDIIISSELVLLSEDTIFSFLGGTDENYFEKRPNDFLKYEMINWARDNEIKFFVLGGGYGIDDGIFKYKKSFFPNDIFKYYTGRKILNESIYYELFMKNNIEREKKGLDVLKFEDLSFFPIYNKND
jgi:hypothetical protein